MTIQELHVFLYNRNEPLAREKFVNAVQPLLDGFTQDEIHKNPDHYLQIISDYAIILSQLRVCDEGLKWSRHALELFEQHPTIKPTELITIKHYETLLFAKASCLVNLKKFGAALRLLRPLVKKFPANPLYSRWYKSARNRFLSRCNLLLLVVLLILLFPVKAMIDPSAITFLRAFLWSIAVLFVLSISLEGVLYMSNKKLKSSFEQAG